MKDTYNHCTFFGGASSFSQLKPSSNQMTYICTVSRSDRLKFIADCKNIIEDMKKRIRNAKKKLAKIKNPEIRAELESKIAVWQKTIIDRQESVDNETKWIEHEKAKAAEINRIRLEKDAWLATTGKNGKIK